MPRLILNRGLLPIHHLLHSFILLCLLTSGAHSQFNQDLTKNTAGTWWQPGGAWGITTFTVKSAPPSPSTVVLTSTRADNGLVVVSTTTHSAATIPILVYNCAWMPYICSKVRSWMTDNNKAWNVDGTYEFTYDATGSAPRRRGGGLSSKGNAKLRRRETCELSKGPWKQNNVFGTCGVNAPCNVFSDKGTFPGGNVIVDKQYKLIQGLLPGQTSGLYWSYDEFPSAS